MPRSTKEIPIQPSQVNGGPGIAHGRNGNFKLAKIKAHDMNGCSFHISFHSTRDTSSAWATITKDEARALAIALNELIGEVPANG